MVNPAIAWNISLPQFCGRNKIIHNFIYQLLQLIIVGLLVWFNNFKVIWIMQKQKKTAHKYTYFNMNV